jgi:hypothetical protein
MPAEQRGSPYKTSSGWGVRWVEHGKRRHHSGFPSKSAALAHFRDVVRPRLVGASTIDPSITLAQFVELYLDGHAPNVAASTLAILRDRLRRATQRFGSTSLRELEREAPQIRAWRAGLADGSRFGATQALRQVLEQAVRDGAMTRNPAKLAGPNPAPNDPRSSRSRAPSSSISAPRSAPGLRSCASRRRPGCVHANGSPSSAETSGALRAWCSSSAHSAAASSRKARRSAAADVCRSAPRRSQRSTRCRHA